MTTDTNKEKKEKNSFDSTVEMFKEDGADTIYLEHYQDGMVTGTPLNSKNGQHWIGMAMISSIEEAVECKYKICIDKKDKELDKYLNKHRKSKSQE